MTIFEAYTGNVLINNALQTIEVLADLKNVSEITPQVLLELYKKFHLTQINKRLKSYTMIFSKNGPLHNDKEFGEKIYDSLMSTIINSFENKGTHQCEITGLNFETTFTAFYEQALSNIEYPKAKIQDKDKTINRCWFPLIGALGSDAQALPQAKYAIKIHPICLVIIQFLPLSACLYKGAILLIDSMNFNFVKKYIKDNVERIQQSESFKKGKELIENIKDYQKGNYLLKGLTFLYEKEGQDEKDYYSDLNLWSFSNSGTGASCEIDRIPSELVNKLGKLYLNPAIRSELQGILQNSKHSDNFLKCLENNNDFYFLYPTKNNKGTRVDFYEAYQKVISNDHLLDYSKYLAGLINKFEKSKIDEKLLNKTDAYQEPNYRHLINRVLVQAVQNNEWSFLHHICILDDKDSAPVNSGIYKIYKMVHFYYFKKTFVKEILLIEIEKYKNTNAYKICSLFKHLITNDVEKKKLIKQLIDPQDYRKTPVFPLLIRASASLELTSITTILYKNYEDDRPMELKVYGLMDLLRIYYNQTKLNELEENLFIFEENKELKKYKNFASDYFQYYASKYKNDYYKFNKHVLEAFPNNSYLFNLWFDEALENLNEYLKKTNKTYKWTDNLLYDERGSPIYNFARFAIEFELNKVYKTLKQSIKEAKANV
jgi:hypothetical protein